MRRMPATLKEDPILSEIVQRIRRATAPRKVVLFGSRARGQAQAYSDYDVLVVKDSTEPRYSRSAALYTLLADLPVEVEVVVYTPEEVEEWRRVPGAFVTTALRDGVALYEEPEQG